MHAFRSLVRFWTQFIGLRLKLFFIRRHKKVIAISLVEHMGDIMACESLACRIRREHPDALIIWFTKKEYQELVEAFIWADKVIPVYCLTEWIRLRKTKLFDAIYDFHIQKRVCPECRIPLIKHEGDLTITLENYFDYGCLTDVFAQCAAIPVSRQQPGLFVPKKNRDVILGEHLPEKYMVIHRRSNEASKDWRDEKWTELIESIFEKTSFHVIEVGAGYPDLDICLSRYRGFCNRLSILETAEVIRRAQFFIGVDSGPAHLASAVGTYGIILLGAYRAFPKYMPFNGTYADESNARMIYSSGPAREIMVSDVLQAIDNYFSTCQQPLHREIPSSSYV